MFLFTVLVICWLCALCYPPFVSLDLSGRLYSTGQPDRKRYSRHSSLRLSTTTATATIVHYNSFGCVSSIQSYIHVKGLPTLSSTNSSPSCSAISLCTCCPSLWQSWIPSAPLPGPPEPVFPAY